MTPIAAVLLAVLLQAPATRAASAPGAPTSDFVLEPPPIPSSGEANPAVEAELDAMSAQDAIDRRSAGALGAEGMKTLRENAAGRKARLDTLWIAEMLVSPRARHLAATLYLYSPNLEDLLRAYALARSAAEAGLAESRLVAVSAEDLALLRMGRRQRWGTQYGFANGRIRLAPLDGTVDDAQRLRWGVPSLEALRAYEEKWARESAGAASAPASRPAGGPASAPAGRPR